MSVTYHYDFHMDAGIAFFAGLGLTEEYVRLHGHSTFSLEQHLNFYDEVLVGHDISCHVRLLDVTAKLLHGTSIVVNKTTGKVANVLEFVEGHVDLSTRRTTPWRPEIASGLRDTLESHRELSWSLPLSGSMGLR